LPLLIPGVGAQGGDAAATVQAGLRVNAAGEITGPVIVNSSRAVLYASSGADFAQAARRVALATRDTLNAAR
jgi:orotidine-5'-phosphate decarboxylase